MCDLMCCVEVWFVFFVLQDKELCRMVSWTFFESKPSRITWHAKIDVQPGAQRMMIGSCADGLLFYLFFQKVRKNNSYWYSWRRLYPTCSRLNTSYLASKRDESCVNCVGNTSVFRSVDRQVFCRLNEYQPN